MLSARPFFTWSALAIAFLSLATTPMGCHLLRLPRFGVDEDAVAVTREELRGDLAALAASFAGLTTAATDEIIARSPDRDVRRAAILWKLRIVPEAYRLAFLPEAQDGYVAMVILAAGLTQYFTEGDGRDLFGAEQGLAITTAKQLEDEAYEIGTQFLTPKQLERLRSRADEFVDRKPIRGLFVTEPVTTAATQPQETRAFDFVLGVPMLPFRALSGVSDGAQAVREFNVTAQRFADIVEVLPELMRWQLDLFFFDAEELETVRVALDAWISLAASVQQIALATQTLPDELSVRLEAAQIDLRATLQEASAALAEADRVFTNARELAGPLREAAAQVGVAGSSWASALGEIRAMQEMPSSPGERDGRPFDIREYAETARDLSRAAVELRGLIEESRSLVEVATWRAIAVLAAFFVLLLAYRLAVRSFLRRGSGISGGGG